MVTDKEIIEMLNNFLLSLHMARWTGNNPKFAILMDRLAAYSYTRTNSNYGDTEEEEERWERTLKNLNK